MSLFIVQTEKRSAFPSAVVAVLPYEIGADWIERFTREAAAGKEVLTLPNGRPLAVEDIEEASVTYPKAGTSIRIIEPLTQTTISVNVSSAAYAVVCALAGAIAVQQARAKQAGAVAPEYA